MQRSSQRAVRAQLFFIDGLIATADVSLALIAPLTDALRLGAPRSEAECIDLIANGVNHIHVFTMNKPEVAQGIHASLSELLK